MPTVMLTCRAIPAEDWVKARERLIFYFSRAHGAENAQDLAQETLAAVWERDDFEFERRENFLPVCLGFARNISPSGYRRAQRYSGGEVLEMPGRPQESAEATERGILLNQVLEKAKTALRDEEFKLILADNPPETAPQEANRLRVVRHRALRKLARVLGQKDKEK